MLTPLLKAAALILTLIALIPGGAHVFELPAKMALDRDDYFVVQRIYADWAWFAAPIFGAIAANAAVAVLERARNRKAATYAGLAAGLIVLSLVVFFAFVFPANQVTANWTQIPAEWRGIRVHWEYGHAAGAALIFAAFLACVGALAAHRPSSSGPTH